MKKIIKKIAGSAKENKITLALYGVMAIFAVVMPAWSVFLKVLILVLLAMSATVYYKTEIK